MTKFVIDIFMYMFETIFIVFYCNMVFKVKGKPLACIFAFIIEHIILLFVYQNNITFLNIILIFIFNMILFKLLYDITLSTAIFHSAVIVLMMFLAEIITLSIGTLIYKDFNAFENEINAYIFAVTVSKILYFSIMMVLAKLFSHRESKEKNDKFFWLLFIVPISNTLSFCILRYMLYQIMLTEFMSKVLIIASFFSLLSNILVFVIYEYSIKNKKKLYEIKTIQQKQEQDKQYFEAVEQSNNEMRIFAHNIKNHLVQIRNLDDMEEIRAYIDKLSLDK